MPSVGHAKRYPKGSDEEKCQRTLDGKADEKAKTEIFPKEGKAQLGQEVAKRQGLS